VLPGGFEISARKTYGRISNGMICAEDELGIGHDHTGIIVLTRLLSPEQLDGVQVGDDAIALLGPRRGGRRGQRHPRPRLLLLRCAASAAEYWHSQGSPGRVVP
jgi:phenylalanyl-tRNA synthetase beta chain